MPRWSRLQEPACAEQLLGESGCHLQVLRGHSGRSCSQRHPQRPHHQLDCEPRDEAPRVPWSDLCWSSCSWNDQAGPPRQQAHWWILESQLEAPQHPLSPQIPINGKCVRGVVGITAS